MSNIGWEHPQDTENAWDGSNDAAIELFGDKPLMHFAREGVQNSIDARHDKTKPVLVKIKLHHVGTASIPDANTLKNNLNNCKNSYLKIFKDRNLDSKSLSFYNKAIEVLNKPTISILQFSDYNTTGMHFNAEADTSTFFNYIKAKGITDKPPGFTGSYGIGKYAPFGVSDLKTLFISTVFQDKEGQCKQVTQGKAILTTFYDNDKSKRIGNGYWGIKNRYLAMEGYDSSLSDWVQRSNSEKNSPKDCGVTISVIGFNSEDHWDERIAVAIAKNYFVAIERGDLEVEIGDKYKLNKYTLNGFMNDDSVKGVIRKEEGELSIAELKERSQYLSTVKDDKKVIISDKVLNSLGECRLRMMVSDKQPKKVCFIRNGMFITDDLKTPGIRSFSDFKDFSAVFECRDANGNELLRSMEPPSHNDFEPDRLKNAKENKEAKKALKEIGKWIREELTNCAREKVSSTQDLDELSEFFGYENLNDDGSKIEEVNPFGEAYIDKIKFKAKKQPSKTTSGVIPKPRPIPPDPPEPIPPIPPGPEPKPRPVPPSPTPSNKIVPIVEVDNLRFIRLGEKSFRLFFTPTSSGMVNLHVYACGADIDVELNILGSNLGQVENGGCMLDVHKGERSVLEVALTNDTHCALKVMSHEI